MKIIIDESNVWYHGSNLILNEIKTGSTITQWRELAKAFSHKPNTLAYDDNGDILHNGIEKGYLYIVAEPIKIDQDIYYHPGTTMDEGVEFLTSRPLKVRLLSEVMPPSKETLDNMIEEMKSYH